MTAQEAITACLSGHPQFNPYYTRKGVYFLLLGLEDADEFENFMKKFWPKQKTYWYPEL